MLKECCAIFCEGPYPWATAPLRGFACTYIFVYLMLVLGPAISISFVLLFSGVWQDLQTLLRPLDENYRYFLPKVRLIRQLKLRQVTFKRKVKTEFVRRYFCNILNEILVRFTTNTSSVRKACGENVILICSILKDVWKSFLASLHVNCEHQDHLLMQCIFNECFNFVIIQKFGMEENPVKIDNLSDDELMHRVMLMKKLTKGSHANKDEFLRYLSDMRIIVDDGSDVESELEDFLAFTKKWVKVTNRGGLFIPKDVLFDAGIENEETSAKYIEKY